MMGRSHAMSGAVGYAALVWMAQVTPQSVNGVVESIECSPPSGGSVSAAGQSAEGGEGFCNALQNIISGLATPITMDREILILILAAGLLVTFGWPRMSSDPKKTEKNVIYRAVQMLSVIGAIFVGMQFIYERFPQVFPQTPLDAAIWLFATAGFALIPDLDEPNSTISRLFGPLSRGVSAVTRKLAGGHRYLTHSWIMVTLGLLLAIAAQAGRFGIVIMGFLLMTSFVLASRMVLPDSMKVGAMPLMIIAGFLAWLMSVGGVDPSPLLLALPAGILLHDMGDWVTNSGIAFTYPSRKKYALKLFGTNSATEHYVVQPILSLSLAAITAFWIVIPGMEWIGNGGLDEFISNMPSITLG